MKVADYISPSLVVCISEHGDIESINRAEGAGWRRGQSAGVIGPIRGKYYLYILERR